MEGRVKKSTTAAKRKPAKAKPAKTTYDVIRDSAGRGYFYFRSEPKTRMVRGVDVKFSYDDLVSERDSTAHWDGVRNHVAKNWMRAMKEGDRALFYHSNAGSDETGVVGVVEVVKEAYPDHTAWDKRDPHFDGRSTQEAPTWHMVDVRAVKKFNMLVPRPSLKDHPSLKDMYMIKQGRISVGPVTPSEWQLVLQLAGEDKIEIEENNNSNSNSNSHTHDKTKDHTHADIKQDVDAKAKETTTA